MKHLKTMLAAACVAVLPGAAAGCAFDAQIGGGISTAHSASIPVALAVYDAISSGRLQHLVDTPAPLALMRANGAMRGFSEALALNSAGLPPVALVLVEAHLWGRITSGSDGTRLQTHVDGPAGGDVILITAEPALRALLDGRISWDAAIAAGLIVVDGPSKGREQLARFLAQRFT